MALPVNRARMDVSAQPLHALLGTMSPNKGISAFPRGELCFSLTRESEAGKGGHCSGSPTPRPQRPGPFLCFSLDLPPPNCSLCTPLLHTLRWPGETSQFLFLTEGTRHLVSRGNPVRPLPLVPWAQTSPRQTWELLRLKDSRGVTA